MDENTKDLEQEKNYWKECYEIALNHLKEIEREYFIEHGYSFIYKETVNLQNKKDRG